MPSNKVKRKLIDSDDESYKDALRYKRLRTSQLCSRPAVSSPSVVQDHEVCARLVTTTKAGRKDAIRVSIEKPVTIGRNPRQCSYVIPDNVVSNIHFKVFAIRTSCGTVLLSCMDTSTNGTLLNGHLIKKKTVILMDGDTLKISSSQSIAFHVLYSTTPMRQQKQTLFDPTQPPFKDKLAGRYRVTSYMLGSGTFATVNLALMMSDHTLYGENSYTQVACKMVKMTGDSEKSNLMKEVDLLKNLNHPNINHIFDVVEQDGFMNIFLELSTGGDLFSYISSRSLGRLKEGEARYCGFQVMLGLQYLHDRNISHRDLKPENILLHVPGPFPRLIIADFGLARVRANERTLNAVGTLSYMSPEAIRALTTPHLGYVGIYADAWSLGLVLFTMLCGYHPFDRCDDAEMKHTTSEGSDARVKTRIVDGPVLLTDSLWDTMPRARRLVGRLLIHNPRHRETVRGALASEWILEELDDLREGYCERIGAFV